jgi:hypothetical protein
MSRQDRLEELAGALREAEQALQRAYLLSRDLGFADIAAQLAALLASLRDELERSP